MTTEFSKTNTAAAGHPVTDVSITARWDPSFPVEEDIAEVGFYAKITPQPGLKATLLHGKDIIRQATILRVVPLLPDGSSPRKSAGTEALNIPMVSGRTRIPRSRIPTARKPDKTTAPEPSRIDGTADSSPGTSSASTGSSVPEAFSSVLERNSNANSTGIKTNPGGEISNVIEGATAILSASARPNEAVLSQSGDENPRKKALQRLLSPEAEEDKIPFDGLFTEIPNIFRALPRTSPFLGSSRTGNNSVLTGPSTPTTPEKGASYIKNGNGRLEELEVYDWDRIRRSASPSVSPSKDPKRDGAPRARAVSRSSTIFSSTVLRDFSPISRETIQKLGGFDGSEGAIQVETQQDGTGEDKRAVVFLTPPKEATFIEEAESFWEEPDKNLLEEPVLVLENGVLSIWFPDNVGPDPVVVELLIEIWALYPANKGYGYFIIGGLPQCKNMAKINFMIEGEDRYWLETYPPLPEIQTEQLAANKINGSFDLSSDDYKERTFLIRFARLPQWEEPYGYKINLETTVELYWDPCQSELSGEFTFLVTFEDINPDRFIKRTVVKFHLINGMGSEQLLEVSSPRGAPPEFTLEDNNSNPPDSRSEGRGVLLHILRSSEDIKEDISIKFRKVIGKTPIFFKIPNLKPGKRGEVIRETVVITRNRQPLHVDCMPGKALKEIRSRPELPGSRLFTTFTAPELSKATDMGMHVSTSPLALSSTLDSFEIALRKTPGFLSRIFIETIFYNIKTWDDDNTLFREVRMSFKMEIPKGLEPMDEMLWINPELHQFSFATFDGRLMEKGTLYQEENELVMINYGLLGNRSKRSLIKHGHWVNVVLEFTHECCKAAFNIGTNIEFALPRIASGLIGRAVCDFGKEGARLISRNYNDHEGYGTATCKFIKGTTSMSGKSAGTSTLYIQYPYLDPAGEEKVPQAVEEQNVPLMATSASESSTECTNDESSTTIPSSLDGTANESEGLAESILETPSEVESAPCQERRENFYGYLRKARKWLSLAMVLLLVSGIAFQSLQIFALRILLRQSRSLLEETLRNPILKSRDPNIATIEAGDSLQTNCLDVSGIWSGIHEVSGGTTPAGKRYLAGEQQASRVVPVDKASLKVTASASRRIKHRKDGLYELTATAVGFKEIAYHTVKVLFMSVVDYFVQRNRL
ncbi:hypothetical protein RUND412_005550 [Rhizina undulata]